ncbi:MAG: hypothetical protein ACLVK8_00495 [Ruminococcus sp.]
MTKALEHEFTDAEEFETFSGFLIGKLGEIPKDGSRLKLEIEELSHPHSQRAAALCGKGNRPGSGYCSGSGILTPFLSN